MRITKLKIGEITMTAERVESPEEITFEYKISPNFAVYSVTGVIGGLNAQGQVIINFFNERSAIPKKQKHAISSTGGLSDVPVDEERKSEVIRDVMFAISINSSTARAFAKWLIQKADQFDGIKQLQKEGGDADR
jgi:hypothetical protein